MRIFFILLYCSITLISTKGALADSIKWTFSNNNRMGGINSAPAIGPTGTIYIGSKDGKLYAIDPVNPVIEKWIFPAKGDVISIDSSPAIGPDGAIYFGADDDRMYALNPDGSCRWLNNNGSCGYLTEGDIDSSPAIGLDGTIYFGSDDNRLYALNPDGSCRWLNNNGSCGFLTQSNIDSSPAISTEGIIYFGTDDGTFYAITSDGECVWKSPDDSCGFSTGGAIKSSPSIGQDGTIYFGSDDNKFYALKPDGSCKWITDDGSCKVFLAGGSIKTAPAIDVDGTIYIGSNDGNLYAINSDNGTEKWRTTFDSSPVESSPVISNDGTIYFGSLDGYLYAVDPNTSGSQLWSQPLNRPIRSAPTIAPDGTIYVGYFQGNTQFNSGRVFAINPTRRQKKWSFPGNAGVDSIPVVGQDGTIYFGSDDTNLYAVNSDGSEKWIYTGADSQINSPPVINSNVIYFGSDNGTFFAVEDRDSQGKKKWTFQTMGSIDSSAAISSNGTIYFGSDDGTMYAVTSDGECAWENLDNSCGFFTNGSINSTPAIDNDENMIYFGSDDGRFYGVDSEGNCQLFDDSDNSCGLLIGGKLDSSPNISINDREEEIIYFGSSNGNLYRFNADTNILTDIFSLGHGNEVFSPKIGKDGAIYFLSEDGKIYSIFSDGRQKWDIPFETGVNFSTSKDHFPTIGIHNVVYISSEDGKLYAIDADSGTEKWVFSDSQGNSITPSIVGSDGTIYIGSSNNFDSEILYAVFPSQQGPWPTFLGNFRHTSEDTRNSPIISRTELFSSGFNEERPNWVWRSAPSGIGGWFSYKAINDNTPTWNWETKGVESGFFRFMLNGVLVNDIQFPMPITSYAPTVELMDGGHIFSVQECSNQIANQCEEGKWTNSSWLAAWVDTRPPLSITTVRRTETDATIELLCDDGASGTGCDQSFYSIDGGINFIEVVGSFSLPINTSPDQIRYYSIDVAGNQESPLTLEGDFTVLELENYFPSTNLSPEAGLIITGRLTRLPPSTNVDLSNLSITLTIAPPGVTPDQCTQPTNDCTVSEVVTDFLGRFRFEFPQPSLFDRTGAYTLQARFDGTVLLSASNAEVSSVLVGASAGYAVIVQGRLGNDSFDLAAHNKTTNRIYDALRARGFADDNIYYFNYNTTQAGVDELPRKERIRWAIERWVVEQRNIAAVPAPFYLIMVDHGTPAIDGGAPASFHVDTDEVITSMELNDWLSTLESELQSVGVQNERVVILGACYSGGFIDELSANGRIIITSAAADEESYKGPEEIEADGTVIRSGEFFLEELFHKLREGETLTQAFAAATEETELFTRRDDNLLDPSSPYRDNAVQHPLLDDNGDGEGSNILVAGGDGTRARGLRLGVGVTPTTNASKQAYISQVTPPISLVGNEDAATLFAKVQNNWRSGTPWVEVRKPTLQLNPRGTSSIQLDNSLQRFPLQTDERSNTASAHWQETLKGVFTEPGRYDVIYFTRDSFTGAVSPVQRSVIYKRLSNTSPPEPFNLISPSSGLVTLPAIFNWEPTRDANDGPIEYYLSMARDVNFTQPVYRSPPLTCSAFVVPRDQSSVLLRPGESFYWVVEAHGTGGGPVFSNKFKITIADANPIDAIVQGLVVSRQNQLQPLSGANINANLSIDPSSIIRSLGDGCYMVRLRQRGTAEFTSTKGGYCPESEFVGIVGQGEIINLNFEMMPVLLNNCQINNNSLPFFDNFE